MPGREARASWLTGQVLRSPDASGQAEAGPGRSLPTPAAAYEVHGGQPLARLILLTVLTGFAVVETINVLTSPSLMHGFTLAIAIASVCVVFSLQVYVSFWATASWPMRRRVLTLAAQGLVTYLPLLILGAQWGGMAGFFAGSLLLLVPGWSAWVLFTSVLLSMAVGAVLTGMTFFNVAYLTVATLDTGLMVFGLSRLSLIIHYLNGTRAELAQLAVVRERERIARDLHDLLGYSLSAITLKAELTRRLVDGNPGRARDELVELLDIARQALADVRLVATGYRNMSLAKEAASVSSLLSTAGIAAEVTVDCGALDEQIDTVLATVLREAVTNILRHSTAQNCSVEASERGRVVRLRVTNDGLPPLPASHRDGGGLENLALRLEAVGGELSASVRDDGQFELLATVAAPAGAVPDALAARRPDGRPGSGPPPGLDDGVAGGRAR
jgi:two-component system sensor histidine kinase DesK